MSSSSQQPPPPLTRIKIRGHRKRRAAEWLLSSHHRTNTHPPMTPPSQPSSSGPIRVVCISDTHNTRPDLPPGDLLIHAGDLTENGSFDEMQAGLAWLSAQPHRHKVFVAGNHDVLLDDAFLARHPARRYGQARTGADLDWGDVVYLRDAAVTLQFPAACGDGDGDGGQDRSSSSSRRRRRRSLTVYGTPWTPQYGVSAFQFRPVEDGGRYLDGLDPREGPGPDVVVSHGPPRLHLDARDFHRAGCPYLAERMARIRPGLVVFGHIHAARGREDVALDGVRRAYEGVVNNWAGWEGVVWMAVLVGLGKVEWLLRRGFGVGLGRGGATTTFVNASVVGGPENELRNEAIVVEL